jgi:hypothetical protein
VQLLANGFILVYDWPQELLTATSGGGAILLVAIIITRSIRRPKNKYVGTYRQVGVTTP